MSPPVILFDPWPRSAAMIFREEMQQRFEHLGSIVGLEESQAGKLPAELVEATLPDAVAIVGQTDLDASRLARAPKLKAIVNVEGNFAQNVDYAECFRRGVQVLSIAPAFAHPVAEMALGLALDLARGITRADRLMRAGKRAIRARGRPRFLHAARRDDELHRLRQSGTRAAAAAGTLQAAPADP